MYSAALLKQQIKKLIAEAMLFLKDVNHYEIPLNSHIQILVTQKIHQLEGIQLMLAEQEREEIDIPHLYQNFYKIKTDLCSASKRWRRQVECKYRDQKSRIGKLYYLASFL